MRPIRLEMKGFSTFSAVTVIDFDNVDLLAFVGPTGSGKSSIIDAMTFALYGSVARYDQKAVAPVISATAVEARVQFDFEVHDVRYTAVRVVKRTKTGAATKEARLEASEQVLAGDEKELTRQVQTLLGLDFGQFNKTVVLPQGKFSEFLHETPANRQTLLRELFGFNIYARMGAAARERAKAALAEANVLDGQLAQLGDVSPEHFEELRREVQRGAELQAEVDAAAAGLTTIDSAATTTQASLDATRRQLSAIGEIHAPDGVDELADRVGNALGAHAAAVAAHEAARQALVEARTAVDHGPNEASIRALLVQLDHRDEAARNLENAVSSLAARDEHVRSVTPAADAARATIEAAHVTAREAKAELSRAEATLADAGDATSAREWVRLHNEQVELRSAAEAATIELEKARSAATECEAARDEAMLAVEAASLLAPAALLAAHLHAGAACPVCEQLVVTVPEHRADGAAEVKAAKKQLDLAKAKLEGVRAGLRAAEQKAAGVGAQLEAVGQRLRKAPDATTATELVAQLEALIAERDAAREAAAAAEDNVRNLESDRALALAVQNAVSALEQRRDAEVRREGAAQQLAVAEVAVAGQPDRAAAEELLRTAQELADARAAAEKAEASAAVDVKRASDLRNAVEQESKEAREAYSVVREAVVEMKPPKPTTSLAEDWKVIVEWASAQSDALTQQIGELELEAARIFKEHVDLLDALRARTHCQGSLAEIRSEVVQRWSDARSALQHADSERERGAKLAVDIATLRETGDVAAKLGQLLRSDGFERWLMEEALRDLVGRATIRLKELTAGGYSLVVRDGAFRVTDHRNADEERDARSLSGGETFLTSLSLALALAEISTDRSSEGTARMDSIFLDEGFGTLDPETLEVVAGTIEELGASGRMVGVVTHIRELAERMPTRFEVSKQNTTSVVQRVDV